jgi:hypothetical protein
MKTYDVELKRTSYITLTVEANSEDEAETKAWEECNDRPDSDDAVWDIESIEESQ